jgi:hypothetical protein
LDRLPSIGRPAVFQLLEDAAGEIGESPYVRQMAISDDAPVLVVSVDDRRLADVDRVLDALAVNALGAILPGLRDGDTRTYLVAVDDALWPLRLRLVGAGGASAPPADPPRPRTPSGLLVEILVRLHGLREDLRLGRPLLAYGQTARLREVHRELVTASLTLDSSGVAWAELDQTLGITAVGRVARAALRELVAAPVPSNDAEFLAFAVASLRLAELVAPNAWVQLADAVDSYRRYLDVT